ncbi:hypothetical protein ACH5RR_041510 [Cinchona calisaya]|uniref:Transcriptional regulator SLK2 n=1 Tax=Cinchona calisaya TaxID=153742 RepID=A0ABD2XUG8_9GENT
MAELNANLASRDENSISANKSLKTVGMSSLLADANFLLPSGAFLNISGNAYMEPYLNIPSSPEPVSSSNLSSLLMDASRVFHQNTLIDQSNQQGHKRHRLQQMTGPGALVESKSQDRLFSPPIVMEQEPNTLSQVLKKPRMDINPDDLLLQQIQQLLLKKDTEQLQNITPQLKALIQNHIQNQLLQLMLNSTLNSCAAHVQQSEQQMRNQLQQQASQQNSSMPSGDDGICARRLDQYRYNLRNRPKDNRIDYWRKFVSEFYAPGAKERWCLSSYKNLGQHVLRAISSGSMEAWCCDICGTKSGKGLEASFEILPGLCKMKFDGGALEEILFLEFPRECRLSSGIMMLEYGKAVQESVYEKVRVVRDGILRVLLRHDLKIISWEFCVRHHKEYLPLPLVARQVNQLICAARKYQSLLLNTASGRVSAGELQRNCNVLLKSAHKLARHMDIPIVNDLGFSKRHVRCLQIADVVRSMKDLMDFSIKRRIGPIESLQTYPRAGTNTNILGGMQTEGQETVEQGSIQNTETDGIRSISMHLGPKSHINDPCMNSVFSSSGDVRSLLADYYHKIMRENLLSTTGTSHQRAVSSPFQGQPYNPGPLHKSMLSSLPSSETSEASKTIQQHMIDKWLPQMVAESRGKGGLQNTFGKQQDQALPEFNPNIISGLPAMARGKGAVNNGPGFDNNTAAAFAQANSLPNAPGSRGISRIVANNTLKINGNKPTIKTEPDLPESHVPEAFRSMGGKFSKKGI